MALRAPTRRDQRRRLLASRTREASAAATMVDDAGEPSPTPYDAAAFPERHPALATRLPVGLGGLTAAILAILVIFAGGIALTISGPLFGRQLISPTGRFAGSLLVVARGFDHRAALPVPVWLGILSLLAAGAVAGSVKHMRRHRRDDYKGRFRAWGWLAALLTLSAWAAAVPLGPLVATAVSEATGVTAGPTGIGWWVGLAGVAFTLVLPWAILPLRERLGTAWWSLLAAAAWGTAAAMPWAGPWVGGDARGAIIGQAAWSAGAGLWLAAMLTAARSVIREVRGETKSRAAAGSAGDRGAAASEQAGDGDDEADQAWSERESQAWAEDRGGWAAGGDSDEEHSADASATAGSGAADQEADQPHRRKLSKAERRRLRKLARMNGEAA